MRLRLLCEAGSALPRSDRGPDAAPAPAHARNRLGRSWQVETNSRPGLPIFPRGDGGSLKKLLKPGAGGGQARGNSALGYVQRDPDLAVAIAVIVAQHDGGRLLRRELSQCLPKFGSLYRRPPVRQVLPEAPSAGEPPPPPWPAPA